MKSIRLVLSILSFLFAHNTNLVLCTIDVNLSELEYLAGHLEPSECRRLVAALHYNTFELPESIAAAERKVDEDIPCLRQLIHWNSSSGEGRGQTHEEVEHRLRQINRNDLADWLGKTTFKQLGKDLDRAIDRAFGEEGKQETEPQPSVTIEPTDEPSEEDPWLPIDTLLFATLVVLFATFMIVCIALVVHSAKLRRNQQNSYNIINEEKGISGTVTDENQKKKKNPKTHKKKKRGSITPRKREDESRDKNSLLETKQKRGCCGTSCNIL